MRNIANRPKKKYAETIRIAIENWLDPEDGYTNEELMVLSYYYDFDKLISDLDKKIAGNE